MNYVVFPRFFLGSFVDVLHLTSLLINHLMCPGRATSLCPGFYCLIFVFIRPIETLRIERGPAGGRISPIRAMKSGK